MARDDVSTVLSTLSLRQKLLLAQAVHQVGTQDWSRVSALLLQHPLVKREPGVATAGGDAAKKAETIEEDGKEKEREKYGAMLAQTLNAKGCEQAWSALMLQQGIVDPPADSQTASNGASPAKSAEDGATPKQDKKAQLALAQSLYAERLEELRAQILEKEERFRALVSQIDDLNSGRMDAQIEAELHGNTNEAPVASDSQAAASAKGAAAAESGSAKDQTPNGSQSAKRAGADAESQPGVAVVGQAENSPVAKDEKGSQVEDLDSKSSGKEASTEPTQSAPTSAPVGAQTPGAAAESVQDPAPPSELPIPLPDENPDTVPESPESGPGSRPSMEGAALPVAAGSLRGPATSERVQNADAEAENAQDALEAAAEAVVDAETEVGIVAEAERQAAHNSDEGVVPAVRTAEDDLATLSDGMLEEGSGASADAREGDREEDGKDVEMAEAVQAPEPEGEEEVEGEVESKEETAPMGVDEASIPAAEAATTTRSKRKRAASSVNAGSSASAPTRRGSTVRMEEDEPSAAEEVLAETGAEKETPRERRKRVRSQTAAPAAAVDNEAEEGQEEEEDAKVVEDEEAAAEEQEQDQEQDQEQQQEQQQEQGQDEEPSKSADAEEEAEEPEKTARPSISRSRSSSRRSSGQGASKGVKDRRSRSRSRAPGNESASTREGTEHEGDTSVEHEKGLRERERASKKHTQMLLMLLTEISNHTHGNIFHNPIKEVDAPDYYALIKWPMDLKTIKARIKEGMVTNSTQLRRDVLLMFANALMYNRPGTEVHRMASEMCSAAKEMIDRFEQTQSFSRRH